MKLHPISHNNIITNLKFNISEQKAQNSVNEIGRMDKDGGESIHALNDVTNTVKSSDKTPQNHELESTSSKEDNVKLIVVEQHVVEGNNLLIIFNKRYNYRLFINEN